MSTWLPGFTRKCIVPEYKTKSGYPEPKQVFPDFDSAMQQMAQCRNRSTDPLNVYRCEDCGGFHVGHYHEA